MKMDKKRHPPGLKFYHIKQSSLFIILFSHCILISPTQKPAQPKFPIARNREFKKKENALEERNG